MTRLGVDLWPIRTLADTATGHIELASELGYEGVSIPYSVHPTLDVDAVNAALERTGLEATAVSVDRKQLQRGLDEVTDLYDRIGVSRLVYHSLSNNWTERRVRDTTALLERRAIELEEIGWDLVYHPNHWDYVPSITWPIAGRVPCIGIAERLDRRGVLSGSRAIEQLELNERRVEKGVNILLDHYRERTGVNSPSDVSELHETVAGQFLSLGPELVGITLDLKYPPLRGYDVLDVLEEFGARISHVHLGDVRVDDVPPGRTPPFCHLGEGDVPYDAFVERAREVGVEWIDVSFDVHDDQVARQAAEEGAAFGRSVGLI